MAKFYIKAGVFFLLFLFVLKVTDRLVVHDELFHTTFKSVFKQKEKFDFIFMGNSLSQRSYDVNFLDNEFNSQSINIGSPAQHFYITKAIFDELIDTKEVYPNKLLVVTISPWQFENFEDDTWKYLQMTALDEIDFSFDYLNIVRDFYEVKDYPKVYSPTIRFHSKMADNIVETKKRIDFFEETNANGFLLNVETKLSESDKDSKKDLYKLASEYRQSINNSQEEVINDKAEQIIKEMIEKSNEAGVNLLFVTPPAINVIFEKEKYGKIKYLNRILKSNGAHYIDLNNYFHELNLTYNDYGDFSHLNKYGCKKVMPFLVNFINKEFTIAKNPKKPSKQKSDIETANKAVNLMEIVKSVSEIESYRTLFTPLDENYQDKSAFILSRISTEESAFSSSKKISTKAGNIYKLNLVIKKGNKGSLFGLRIQGIYPDRVDAVFDLDKGDVLGIKKSKDFTNESASIEPLENGWYKCSITAQVNSDFVKILFGPTSAEKDIVGWEGKTSEKQKFILFLQVSHLKKSFNKLNFEIRMII